MQLRRLLEDDPPTSLSHQNHFHFHMQLDWSFCEDQTIGEADGFCHGSWHGVMAFWNIVALDGPCLWLLSSFPVSDILNWLQFSSPELGFWSDCNSPCQELPSTYITITQQHSMISGPRPQITATGARPTRLSQPQVAKIYKEVIILTDVDILQAGLRYAGFDTSRGCTGEFWNK